MRRTLALAALLLVGCGEARHVESPTTAATTIAPRRPARHPRHVERRPPRPLRLPARAPKRTLVVPILMYHRVDVLRPTLAPLTRGLTVTPQSFAAQMRWLVRTGRHGVTQRQLFGALEHGRPLPPRPVMVTFDDGYRDVLGRASPILRRLHLPATAYVITDRISGPDPSFLTWPELRVLERRGVEIGSHTVDHTPLTSLGDTRALWELRASRATLQRHLRHPVQWLAYPHGAEDARIVALARRAGYVLATTERYGTLQDAAAPLELRRIEVLDTTTLAQLAAALG